VTTETKALELPPDAQALAMGLEDAPTIESTPAPEAPETPAPAPTPPPAPEPAVAAPSSDNDPVVSRAFEKIAEREREQRRREQELKALEDRLKPVSELAGLIEKKDKWSLLERMGVTYDELTKEYVQGKGVDPTSQMKAELERVREDTQRQIQEIRAAEERRRFEEERSQVRSLVQSGSYPHLQAVEGHDLVLQTIQKHYDETGDIVSYEDAAEVVETSLGQMVEKWLQVPSVRQKYAALFTPASPEKSSVVSEPRAPQTLRNQDAQDRVTLVAKEPDSFDLDDDESIARLASQLKFLKD
jgi:hypothetical protein